MESHRKGNRLTLTSRRGQAGVTVIGFLILASLFGLVALGGIKVVPMYIKNMRMSTILDDVQRELSGTGTNPAGIRNAISKRLSVESIDLAADSIKINQANNGYQVRVQYEERAPYIADVWLLVAFDKQVEIRR
jgi:hypothetical protein